MVRRQASVLVLTSLLGGAAFIGSPEVADAAPKAGKAGKAEPVVDAGPKPEDIGAQARTVYDDLAGSSDPRVRVAAFEGRLSLAEAGGKVGTKDDRAKALAAGLEDSFAPLRDRAIALALSDTKDKKTYDAAFGAVVKLLASSDADERDRGLVFIDGPKAVHDRNRVTVGGQGTYETVARKVRLLLSTYRARPVGARVTLTRGTTDIIGIWDHLFNELGFAEVGFAPVTAGDVADFNLSGDELVSVFSSMKTLGEHYIEAACEGRNIGFSNLHQLLTDIHEGAKKALPCGAGYSMVAVDREGGVNLCHRFTGSELPTFGNVDTGLDRAALGSFLEQRLDRSGTGCDTCRIRNLCSGGCYHESYQRYGDPAHPTYHYCDLMRDWVDFALGAYARILAANPGFFSTHLAPRRARS